MPFNCRKILKISLVAAVALFGSVATATVGRWIIPPGFESITRISGDLFVVRQAASTHGEGRVGVINKNGKWVVEATVDSITGFRNGYALVMSRNENGEYRLMSILPEKGDLTPINEDYIVAEYPFFSEDLLGVYYKGKAGYIDPNGRVVIPFKYGSPQPFSSRLAAVAKKGGLMGFANEARKRFGLTESSVPMMYINTAGKEIKIDKSIGEINLATTFNGDLALVRNKLGEYYYINRAGKIHRHEQSVEFELDDRGAVASGTSVPTNEIEGVRDPVTAFRDGRLIGYQEGGAVVIPAQFSNAGEFIENIAPVSIGQKWGVVQLAAGQFDVKLEVADSVLPDTSKIVAVMDVVVPESLRHLNLKLIIMESGRQFTSEDLEARMDGRYKIEFQYPKKGGDIRLQDTGLDVWDLSMLPGGFDTEPPLKDAVSFNFSATSVKANSKDAATITLTIANNTRRELKLPLKVKGAYAGKKSIVVPAGGSVKVPLSFAKILKAETRTVTVTAGETTVSRKISLLPFFSE